MEWCKLWNGETATAKQAGPSSDKREKEQAADNREVQDRLENYLWKHYEFRFNVLTEQPEYCAKGQGTDTPYKIVTQRTLNTLCLEAHRHRINCWDKDVSRLLHSERLEDYHPFLTYMDTLPQWDGVDRITPLAQRISKKAFWINGFHRWMLGMAAQWAGRMDRCANAVAPMLVSRMQGKCKSTFCQLLMPDGLRDYYTDSFELTGQSGCEQKLAQFGLINLDEYDRLSPQKLPLLKTLMQMKKLDFRKSHRSSYSHLPRMASFIGTSNHKDLLTDPTGSRRYLCAEVKEKIDCTPLEHKQLFAQLKAELEGGERYWFSAEEEAELQLRNREFYAMPVEQEVFYRCFRLPEAGEEFKLYSASVIFTILQSRYPAAMRGMTVVRFGKMMSASDELMDRYYLVLLGEKRDMGLHPMEAKKLLAWKITARYHDSAAADAARSDWETRFSKRDLAAADLPEVEIASLPAGMNALALVSFLFENVFQVKKSNGVLRKEHFTPGAIQLNDVKMTDPSAVLELAPGNVLRLSKKHAVRFK